MKSSFIIIDNIIKSRHSGLSGIGCFRDALNKKDSGQAGMTVSRYYRTFYESIKIVIASVFLVFIAGLAIPEVSLSSEPDDNVEKIQKAYEKIKDMKGSFTQKNTIKDLNKTDTYKGEFSIKHPLKMKWVYTGKAAQDIFINNETVLIYKKGDKQAYKAKFDRATYGQTPVALLSGFGNIREEFIITGKGNTILLKPRKSLGNVTSISLSLSEEEFPIQSFTIQDGSLNVIEIMLKNVKVNTGLKDSVFESSLPKGVNIFEYNNP